MAMALNKRMQRIQSRNPSDLQDSERNPRIFNDLQRSGRHAFSNGMNANPRSYAPSAMYRNTDNRPQDVTLHYASSDLIDSPSERPATEGRFGVHFSRVNHGSEAVQILPPPPPPRPVFKLTAGGIRGEIPDSWTGRRSRAEGLRAHYSMANNSAEVQILPPPTRAVSALFTTVLENNDESNQETVSGTDRRRGSNCEGIAEHRKFTIFRNAIWLIKWLVVLLIIIALIVFFAEPKSSSFPVSLVILFLGIGLYALHIVLVFCYICTIPCREESPDLDF